MNRKTLFYVIVGTLLVIISGCSKSELDSKSLDYKYSVIETTSQENNTYISFYDDDLKKIGEEKIKYGSMGNGFTLPLLFEGSMFIVPKGIATKKEHTFIMEYDLKDNEINKHNTGLQNMNSITINKDFIYGVNTMDFTTNIVQYNRDTEELIEIKIPEVYINYLSVQGDELFGLGEDLKEEGMNSFIYIIDSNTLEILKEIDITEIGHGCYDLIMKDNDIYFSTSYSIDGVNELPNSKLIRFNRESEDFSIYELKEDYPFQILEYKDNLLITHFDPVSVTGNGISIFNMEDESSKTINLDHNIEQLAIDGEDIIILGEGSFYIYDEDFILKESTSILEERNTNYHYYTTGFFYK